MHALSTKDAVLAVINSHLGINNSGKHLTSTIPDLGGDSLDLVEVIFMLEDDFDIRITDEDMYATKTVQDLIELVQGKITSK